jgi:hypothetical protein
LNEIKNLYQSLYAPAIDNFLETRWFQSGSLPRLLNDNRLLDQFALLNDRLQGTQVTTSEESDSTAALEMRLIWALMKLGQGVVTTASSAAEGSASQPQPQPNGSETGGVGGTENGFARFRVFENLLSGNNAETNELPTSAALAQDQTAAGHQKFREMEFWYLLARFTTLRNDDAAAAKEIDDTLDAMRKFLDGRENRDVLYSIAITKHIGGRISEMPANMPSDSIDERDPRSRLFVARRFLEEEAKGKGTSRVIRALCEMAVRSWTISS